MTSRKTENHTILEEVQCGHCVIIFSLLNSYWNLLHIRRESIIETFARSTVPQCFYKPSMFHSVFTSLACSSLTAATDYSQIQFF